MIAKLSPIVSEFETAAEATSYDRWFHNKVAAGMADTRPGIPHADVMAEVKKIIAAARRKSAAQQS